MLMSAQGTPVSANSQSPVGRTSTIKAPSKAAGKRRAGTLTNRTMKRATRRELKKLTEMDLEEKDDLSLAGLVAIALDSWSMLLLVRI